MLLNRKKPSLLDTTTYVMRSATEALSNRGYNLRDTCADMLLSLTCRSMTEKNNFAWHSDLHAAATKAPNNREYNLHDPNTLLSAKHQSMKKKKILLDICTHMLLTATETPSGGGDSSLDVAELVFQRFTHNGGRLKPCSAHHQSR